MLSLLLHSFLFQLIATAVGDLGAALSEPESG